MKRPLAICLVVAAAALPATGAASRDRPLFEFGRKGGTIMPFTVAIASSGTVSVTGTVHRLARVTVSAAALAGLQRLTVTEGFFSMKPQTNCDPTISGLATNYIRARIGSRDKTVGVVGGCNKRFSELFEILKAVAAVSTAPRAS